MSDIAKNEAELSLYRVSRGEIEACKATLKGSLFSLPQASEYIKRSDDSLFEFILFVYKRYPELRETAIADIEHIEMTGQRLNTQRAYSIYAASYLAACIKSLDVLMHSDPSIFKTKVAASCSAGDMLSQKVKSSIDNTLGFSDQPPPRCR